MTAFPRLILTEAKLFMREPINLLFALAFPPVLMIVLGSVPSFREPIDGAGGIRVIDLYTPVVIAIALALIALATLPQQLAMYREKGALRRLRVTPVQPSALLAAQVLVSAALATLTSLLVVGIARFVFDVPLPDAPVAFAISFLLTTLSLFTLGLLVAAVAPTSGTATVIGLVLFFPLMFFAGLWIPRDSMNDVLKTISDFTPLGAGVQSLTDATSGEWPQIMFLGVLLAWSIIAGGLAARLFRWE